MAMRPLHRTTGGLAGVSLVGRVLLSAIFIISGISKLVDFQGSYQILLTNGIPLPKVFLIAAMVLELLGGLSLLLGLKARWGAVFLLVYLVPVTVIFHGFWLFHGADFRLQLVQFLKNLAIMGGLFQVLAAGPGRWSVDEAGGGGPELDQRDTSFKLRRVS